MNHRFTVHLTALAAVALLTFGASQAFAAYTPAGTTVQNQASLTYEVNTIEQNEVFSKDDLGNDFTSFVVDRVVRPVVTRNMATNPLPVTPGAVNQTLTFNVENDGNDVSDGSGGSIASKFTLALVAAGTNDATPTLSYQVDGVAYNLGDAVEIAAEDTVEVTIHGDFAKTALHGQIAKYYLVATAVADDGTTPLQNNGPLDAGDNIIRADAASADVAYQATDTAGDGTHSDSAQYNVVSASLAVEKTQSLIEDTFGNTVYYVPGATVRYTIEITNNGTVAADNVTVTDTIPPTTTWAGNLTATGASTAAEAGGTVTVTYNSITAGSTVTITFDVTIN